MSEAPGRRGLTSALEALVTDEVDVADVLTHLVVDAAEALGASAVAVLVSQGGELVPLAATSHRAAELEILQAQTRVGPCIQVMESGELVEVAGQEALVGTWGSVGEAIHRAGFDAVQGHPMRWRGQSLGGLNLFFDDQHTPPANHDLGRAFANMATLVLAHSVHVPTVVLRDHLEVVFAARQVVEQAKGIIAEQEGLTMEQAFARLRGVAHGSGVLLGALARDVATRGRLD